MIGTELPGRAFKFCVTPVLQPYQELATVGMFDHWFVFASTLAQSNLPIFFMQHEEEADETMQLLLLRLQLA